MMDAQPLYPEGYHPARPDHTPDALYKVTPLSRADHPVRYYYIDFGLSTCFSPGASSHVVGEIGRDTEVPELSDDIPYDAYKVDIFSLGNVYSKEFEQVRAPVGGNALALLMTLVEVQRYGIPPALDR